MTAHFSIWQAVTKSYDKDVHSPALSQILHPDRYGAQRCFFYANRGYRMQPAEAIMDREHWQHKFKNFYNW